MLGGEINYIDAAQRAIGCFSNRTLDGGNTISIGRLPEHTEECFDLAHVNAPVRCYPSGLVVASSSKGGGRARIQLWLQAVKWFRMAAAGPSSNTSAHPRSCRLGC